MKEVRRNIVWLTEWLPTSFEPYNGDGIERRAKAASLYNNIFLIYVKKDPRLRFGRTQFEERTYNEHCKAFIYYYPSIKKTSGILDFFLSNYYFLFLHRRALRKFKKKYGRPAGIQVNVTMKNGIIALLYRWLTGTKYIVVEGWSLFLPEERKQFDSRGSVFRLLAIKVLKNASLLVTVSKHLGEMINQHVLKIPYKVVPSVVDTTIFFPSQAPARGDQVRFIHISNLSTAKNMEQILLAFQKLLSGGEPANMEIYAPLQTSLKDRISSMGMEGNIILHDEAPQPELAAAIRESEALILFSLYETFGNVVIEAQACGIPVITSDYPTFAETVEDGMNGIIAPGKDAVALAQAMTAFIRRRENFDPNRIAARAAARFSFDAVGKMLEEIYSQYF